MSSPQVNGDVPHSAFIEHLLGYPVINDGVETFRSNPYGQRSLELGDSCYRTFAAPVMPYLSRPYAYVSPYIKKADSLGDKTLCKVDERWPVVKKPTGELYQDARNIVLYPYRVGVQGRNHVVETYTSEKKKVAGGSGGGATNQQAQGLITYGKALVTTAVVLTSQTVTTVVDYLSAKKETTKNAVDEKTNGNH